MEKEVHRLERLLSEKQETIKELTHKNNQIQKQLKAANKEIQTLRAQAHNNFSYQNVPDREIIQTLQAKLASSAWQILQLQKMNRKYEDSLIKLQTELLHTEQELGIKRHQLDELHIIPHSHSMEDYDLNPALKQWEESIKEKEALVDENLLLKNKIKSLEIQLTEKMAFYFEEVISLSIKIKNQHENEKSKFSQFENLIKQVKKQNELLRESLNTKNQQLMAFYQEIRMVDTDKASDMHTIRNLRNQIKKKGEEFFKILMKLQETEELKKKLVQFNNTCSQTMGEFNKLAAKFEQTKKENGILKQKHRQESLKVKKLENIISEENKKLYQLLIENQVCHELLYQARGFSNLFLKDVEEKVQRYLMALEKRKQNHESWLDVTQLIAVNQKLRMRKFGQDSSMQL